MKEKAIFILDNQGVESTIQFLKEQHPITKGATGFNDLIGHAYWNKHDIESTVTLAQAGISYSAEQAKLASDESKEIFLTNIMQISYNLASFTWPGWEEDWLGEISSIYLKLGQEAAKSNLHYALELKKGELSYSRSHWIVAAHQLAAGEFHLAEENFEQAVTFAIKAGEKGDELLSKGFVQVARLLVKPKNLDAYEQLAIIKTTLKELEHGEFFIKQLNDSLRIFS